MFSRCIFPSIYSSLVRIIIDIQRPFQRGIQSGPKPRYCSTKKSTKVLPEIKVISHASQSLLEKSNNFLPCNAGNCRVQNVMKYNSLKV